MKQYTDFLEVGVQDFQPYKMRGWEVIEKIVRKDYEFGESIYFLIGYPLEKAFEDVVHLLSELKKSVVYEDAWAEVLRYKGFSDENFKEVSYSTQKPTEYTTLKETDRFILTGNRDKFIEKDTNLQTVNQIEDL